MRPRDRVAVIPLGLDDFAALPAIAPGPSPGIDLRILFVGRLEARKGIDVLLAALPEILGKFPSVQVDIVGNDRLPSSTDTTYRLAFDASAIEDDVRRRVHFHGEVTDPQLRGFYRACDIFVAPSRFESFGLIFVEAMIFGKPVIGCRAGGMPEIIVDGETGLLAEPGDARTLRACLEKLITDAPLRHRLGEAGRRRYETHFTARRMAESVADLLTDTANVRPAA